MQITIPQDMIGSVIGPGGKGDPGHPEDHEHHHHHHRGGQQGITSSASTRALDGAHWIKAIVAIPEVGETYHGRIRSIVAFGAFVEIMPGKDALLHISEIDYKRFETMEETGLKEGDEIDVKLIGIDPKTGKLKLAQGPAAQARGLRG